MIPSRETVVRWLLAGICLFSSIFALLCYIPFTWNDFISNRIYPPALALFLHAQPWLFAAAVLLGADLLRKAPVHEPAADAPASRRPWGERLPKGRVPKGWVLVNGAFCLIQFAKPLGSLVSDGWSLVWALLAWTPLLGWEWAAASVRPRILWAERPEEERAFPAAALSASVLVFLSYSAAELAMGSIPLRGALPGLGWSLVSHLLLAGLVCAVYGTNAGLCSLARGGVRLECALWYLWFLLAAAAMLMRAAMSGLSFRGLPAWAYVLAAAASVTAALYGQAASARARDPEPVRDPFGFMVYPLSASLGDGWRGPFAALLALSLVPALLRRALTYDWNFLLQTLSVYWVWGIALALCHLAVRSLRAEGIGLSFSPKPWAVAGSVCVLAWAADAAVLAADPVLRRAGIRVRASVLKLSDEEPSLRAFRRLFRRAQARGSLYQFMQSRTNLPRTTPVKVPDLGFGPRSSQPPFKPDVFVFIVDSLRRDYLGVYAPKVKFTPAIDAFAREAALFPNSFTVYGGTALSEPAIWVGGMLPHLQYPEDFARMNRLEKLIEEEGYRLFVTHDIVLKDVLKPPAGFHDLAPGEKSNFDYCLTVEDLKKKLSEHGPAEPTFTYVQSQDLHISSIERAGRSNVTGKTYPGFDAAYASRVETVDGCFGSFLQYLKKTGRWERSVVVLAADHGDSLGEGGRWGHAYTVYPEVLRVPIMVRAPEALLAGRKWDLASPAYIIDIAPTVAALLGRSASSADPLLGLPLLASPERSARETQFVGSSYGAVYGLLKDKASRLYIADGVSYREHVYDLALDPYGRSDLAGDQSKDQEEVRAWLGRIDALYGLSPD